MTLDEVLIQLAKEHHSTPEHIRQEMENAMAEAKKTTNPRAKALWASIPRKGDDVTLEELIEYVAAMAILISAGPNIH